MPQPTDRFGEYVEFYNREKIIVEGGDDLNCYSSVESVRRLEKEAELGIHYPFNDEILEACERYFVELYS